MPMLLNIVYTILARNPELTFQTQLDLDNLISEAFYMFARDNQLDNEKDFKPFFSSSYSVTTSYLAREVVNSVLQGCRVLTKIEPHHDCNDCKVS